MPRLPRLTNAQYEYVAKVCRDSGVPINQCPTCLAKPIEVEEGIYGFENGTFKYRGEIFDCDCQRQMDLRIHYILANIGTQFQRLNWDDFTGSQEVRDFVAEYLANWESFKLNGMGVEFSSPNLGTGKTFSATHIGKELVKRGESVYCMDFRDVIHLLNESDEIRMATEGRLRDCTVLILDEIVEAISYAQGELFAVRFEELIRYRTNFNRVNIITTNLTPQDLSEAYPRTYSLLAAKNMRLILEGEDQRQGAIKMDNWELALNGEVRLIT